MFGTGRRQSVGSAGGEAPPGVVRPRRHSTSGETPGGRRKSNSPDSPWMTSSDSMRSEGYVSEEVFATFTMENTNRQRGPRSVWSNPDKWKQRLLRGLPQPVRTSMIDRYKETGWAQRLAKSNLFEWSSFLMIFANAVWIGIDAELNDEDILINADAFFQVGENLFSIFFFVEWIIRFTAIRSFCLAFSDAWFILDTVLMLLMVMETWLMTAVLLAIGNTGAVQPGFLGVLSLLRLSRVARMARLLRASPELLIMVKGILAAMKSVLITMGLQAAVIYIFGIALKQLASGTAAGNAYFSSVFQSMYSLAMHATLLDSPSLVLEALANDAFSAALVFFLVILVSSLLLLNMLIGVLCEVVSNVSSVEKEQLEVSHVREKVFAVFEESGLDLDGDGQISKHELLRVLENTSATDHLRDAGVDVIGLVDLADVIFQSDSVGREYEKQLTMVDFMKLILQLRGTNSCTVKDIVDLRKYLHKGRTESNNQLERIEERLKHMERLVISQPRRNSSIATAVTQPRRKTLNSTMLPSPQPPEERKTGSIEPPPMIRKKLQSDANLEEEIMARHSRENLELIEEIQSLQSSLDETQSRMMKLIPSLDAAVDWDHRDANRSEEMASVGAKPSCDRETRTHSSCSPLIRQGAAAECDMLRESTAVLCSKGTELPHSVDEKLV